MDENLRNNILDLTSSELVVDWLELCGFKTINDIDNINEKVISDMETYIGTVCSLMPVENVNKYIDADVFREYPGKFKMSPCLKNRLMFASRTISRKFRKPLMTKSAMSKSICNYSMLHLAKLGCVALPRALHDMVRKSILDKFGISDHLKELDFTLYHPKDMEEQVDRFGFFSCSITQNGYLCDHIDRFTYNDNKDDIILDNIFGHMELHFGYTDTLNESTVGMLMKDNRNRSSTVLDLADARLCSELIHDEIIRAAEIKFIDCHLVRDSDFNIYEILDDDFQPTNRGCFLCYICLKSKSCESKIKFSFTPGRSVINSNILAHLRRHFQNVPPCAVVGEASRTTLTKSKRKSSDTSITKHFPKKILSKKKSNLSAIKMEDVQGDKENIFC